ncbi:hypothetical protein Fot_14541 [Forsythia ovata]|uniref:Uncharacterized protein n=1 Tax=Forsythia ovata TaxID=205694 RepID=A0ABD1W6M4_9LAMI
MGLMVMSPPNILHLSNIGRTSGYKLSGTSSVSLLTPDSFTSAYLRVELIAQDWVGRFSHQEDPSGGEKMYSDNDQKKTIARLSLKGGEKGQDASMAPSNPKQTVLVPSASSQGLQLMVQKRELGIKKAKEEKAKEVSSEVGVSSKPSLGDEDDVEILE